MLRTRKADVVYYDLDTSVDGGEWQRVLTHTLLTSHLHTCPLAHFCIFRVTATDHVGNSASAEARTGISRVVKYYHHGGTRVAMRAGDVVYWLHTDHLGSVSLVTDYALRVTAQQRFLPYGGVRYTEGTFPTDFGFTGQRAVLGTGLIFMHARFYHPALGRFTQADTIVPNPGSPQDLNRYSYARNSPVLYCDPTGHCITPFCIGEIIVGIAVVAITWNAMQVNVGEANTPPATPAPQQPTATTTPSPAPTAMATSTPMPTASPEPTALTSVNSQKFISPFGDGVSYRTGLDFYGHPGSDRGLDMVSANDPYYPYILDDPTGQTGFFLNGYNEPLDSQTYRGTAGREVYAVTAGTVFLWSDGTGLDLYTTIEGTEYRIQYAHVSPQVSNGGVDQETVLGYYARIGRSDIPHLHLSIRKKVDGEWQWVDPKTVLPR